MRRNTQKICCSGFNDPIYESLFARDVVYHEFAATNKVLFESNSRNMMTDGADAKYHCLSGQMPIRNQRSTIGQQGVVTVHERFRKTRGSRRIGQINHFVGISVHWWQRVLRSHPGK
ncbi:hypothetical protein D3C87_1063130 [compost metagenome]